MGITKTANPAEATAIQESRYLARVAKLAPEAPVAAVQELAHEFAVLDQEKWDLEMVLIALSSILLDDNGRVNSGSVIPEFENLRPGIKWALEKVAYQHASAVCGPIHDGVGYCLDEIEKRLAQLK